MNQLTKSDQLYLQLRRRIAGMGDGEAFPTIRQLMTEFGVSQATVTPAVNLLKEKGLLQAHVGRGSFVCKEKTTPVLLLLQNSWPSEIFTRIKEAYQEAAAGAGFRFEHAIYDYREDVTRLLHQYEADVILLDGIADDLLTPEQILAISRSPVPVILSRNTVPVSQINYVCGDNAAAGATAANYLVRLGHKKLAILINEPHLYTVEAYRRGFESVAFSSGCTVEILDCKMKPGDRCEQQVETFMKEFHGGKYDFTALFPVSCSGAILAKKYLAQLGMSVPEDLSIISAGTIPALPWLTTVDSGVAEYKEYVIGMAKEILERKANYKRQIEFRQVLSEGTSVKKIEIIETITLKERLVYV